MHLYHGSEFIIQEPVFKGGKRNNDYGYGFYGTEFPDMAREWAVTEEHDGYLNRYSFDETGLKILNLNEYSVLTWLAVLLENRQFSLKAYFDMNKQAYVKGSIYVMNIIDEEMKPDDPRLQ